MRRTDRELTNIVEILRIIEGCDVCRLGLCDGAQPYVVPLNFGFAWADGTLTLYFHCANEGRKLALLRQNPAACFEMDRACRLIPGPRACDYAMAYESVIGSGTVAFCESNAEKEQGLRHIMSHYAPGGAFEFDDVMLRRTTVLKLTAAGFAGKRRQ